MPLRAAFPFGARVSTKTFPLASSSRTIPRGLFSSTMRSSALAERCCLENRDSSSSDCAMDSEEEDDDDDE